MELASARRQEQLNLLRESVDNYGKNIDAEKIISETRLEACAGLIVGFMRLLPNIEQERLSSWLTRVPKHYWEIIQLHAQHDLVALLKTSILQAQNSPAEQPVSFSLDKPRHLKPDLKPFLTTISPSMIQSFYATGWEFATSEFIYGIIPASTYQRTVVREQKPPITITRFNTTIPKVTVTTKHHQDNNLCQNTLTIR